MSTWGFDRRVYPRARWAIGASRLDPRVRRISLLAPEVWIHHSLRRVPRGASASLDDEAAFLREMERYHIEDRGYFALAYSFVIFPSGRIWEGRGWGRFGAHTYRRSTTSHGICFVGDFMRDHPTQAALDACRWLIHRGRLGRFVGPGPQPTGGHRDAGSERGDTTCPGDHLFRELPRLERPWEPGPWERMGDVRRALVGRGRVPVRRLRAVAGRAKRALRSRASLESARSSPPESPRTTAGPSANWTAGSHG